MYTVAEIAKKLNLARSTLLYYERQGLVCPARTDSGGYRSYSEEDLERLVMLRQLHKAGLTLSECRDCLEGGLDSRVLDDRLEGIERQMEDLLLARDLLLAFRRGKGAPAGLAQGGPDRIREWHLHFERKAPRGHGRLLKRLGYSEKDSLHIRWVSRNMNDHETYMEHFLAVFEQMKRQGPGSEEDTRRAFEAVADRQGIKNILDVGCGSGESTLALARISGARLTGVDNHEYFLNRLRQKAKHEGLDNRVATVLGSMTDLPFGDGEFDLVWAEGSAYIMGFEEALRQWRRFIAPKGYLVVSELVWLVEKPSPETREHWAVEYPDVQGISTRREQAGRLGYKVLDCFALDQEVWREFYRDTDRALEKAQAQYGPTRAFHDIQVERDLFFKYPDEFGYAFFVLQRTGD